MQTNFWQKANANERSKLSNYFLNVMFYGITMASWWIMWNAKLIGAKLLRILLKVTCMQQKTQIC